MEPVRRCAHLDDKGRQCRKEATHRTYYFGDPEITGPSGGSEWICAWFCTQHFKPFARRRDA